MLKPTSEAAGKGFPALQPVDPANPDPAAIRQAAEVVRRGGVVAFPTDTVYGIGCLPEFGQAVERIYQIKGRPPGMPLILLVAGPEAIEQLAERAPEAAREAARRRWPGGLTIIIPAAPVVPRSILAGGETVGLRMPDHPVALALIRRTGPMASTSANRHRGPSPVTAQQVLENLGAEVDLILDAGPCSGGIPSTVVDFSVDPPRVLRQGAVSFP